VRAGTELKKELGQLQSLKLEVEGKAVLKDSQRAIDGHITALTNWYTRQGQRQCCLWNDWIPILLFRSEKTGDEGDFESLKTAVTAAVDFLSFLVVMRHCLQQRERERKSEREPIERASETASAC
jgi:hypothetical protein